MTRRALILVLAVLCGGLTLAPAAQAHAYLQGDYYATLQDALGDFDNQLDALFTTYTGCPSWSTNCTGTYGPQTAVYSLVVGQNGPTWDGTADHGAAISPAWAYSAKGVNDWKSFTMLEEVLRTDTCLAGIGLAAVNTIRSTFAANLAKPMPEMTVMGVRVRADVTYVIGITLDTYVNITTGATNTLCETVTLIGNTCFDVDIEPLEQLVDSANERLDDTVRNMTAAYMTVGDYRGVYYWKSFMGRLAFSFIKELLPGLLAAIGKSDDGSVYIPTDNPGEALMAAVYMALAQATVAEGGDDKASQVCPPWGTVNDMHLDWTNGLPQRIDFDGGNVQNPQIDIQGTSLCTAVTNFANNYDIGAGKYSERNQYLALGTAVPNQGNLNRDTGNVELNKTSYDAVGGDVDAWLKREGARLDFFFTQQPVGPVAPAFMGTHTFNAAASAPTSVAIYWYYSDNGVDWTLDAGGTSYTPTFNFYSFGGDVVSRQYQARAVTDCAGTPYTLFSNIITVSNVAPPPITFGVQPPATTNATPGQTVALVAGASCPYGFITYQWQKWDGAAWQNVPGATNATLNLGVVNAGMAGQYQCVAYNQISTKGVNPVYYQASNPATLNVAPDIVITQQPVGGDLNIGDNISLSVVASVSSGTLTYQWQRNVGFGFQVMSGEISDTLALTGVSVNDAGSYRCVVTNTEPTYGVYSLFSAAAVVNVSSGLVIYVDPTAPGPADGLTWDTAFVTIQEAIDLAASAPTGGEVWVAGGTQAVPVVYNEARTEAWGAPSSVAGSLVMKDNVAVYGGFEGYRGGAGKLEANRRDRNRWQNVATIAAPVAGAYHVVVFGKAAAATVNSTLDGFMIAGGNAAGLPGDFHTWRGGGIYNWQSAPTIANCVISGNTAATSGGGIANISSLTLEANAVLRNLVVVGNTASRLDDLWLGGSPMRGGGGIFNDGASPNLTWVTVVSNSAPAGGSDFGNLGGGMYSFMGSPIVNSSIFWGNGGSEIEDNTVFGDASATTVTYSDTAQAGMVWDIDGSYTFPVTTPAAGTGNIYVDPQVDALWIPVAPGSPVIDTADPMLAGDDLRGAIRPADGNADTVAAPDMGAMEWINPPVVACLPASLNITLATSLDDPLALFDADNSTLEAGIWYLELASNTFGCAEVGTPQTVRLTVYDVTGASGFCDAPVTVFEDEDPVVVTGSIARDLDGSGSYALTNADIQELALGSSDNCGIDWPNASVVPATVTCASLGGPTNVTVTLVDASGNSASAVAQVTVSDVTDPVAVSGNNIDVDLDFTGAYTLSAADGQALATGATDNCTVDWAATQVDVASFTCANLGANNVTVTVFDTEGNSTTAPATVTVFDANAPLIDGLAPKSFAVGGPDFSEAEALAGVTASDNCSGSVAVSVVCLDASLFPVPFPVADDFNTGGVYPYDFTLRYTAQDGSGNIATQDGILTLVDNFLPVITIVGDNPATVECPAGYTDQGATAEDTESGTLTAVPSGLPINTGVPGTYYVTYSATDPVTYIVVTEQRQVDVVDTVAPAITLQGPATLGVALGGTYTDPGYTASDACAGDISGAVVVGGDVVDTGVAATYVVTYDVTDGFNAAVQQTRTVIVAELLSFTTQPVGGVRYVDGAPVVLTAVFEDGVNPATFQWFVRANGGAPQAVAAPVAVPLDGILTLTVTPSVVGAGSYEYYAAVTDDTGVTNSDSAAILVAPHMSATTDLEDKGLRIGEDGTWSVAVTGGLGTVGYQWLKDDGSKAFVPVVDGAGITGSATDTLAITGFTAGMAGFYQVEATDDFENLILGPAGLAVEAGVPAAGGLGLGLLAALAALGGAVTIRRRK
jgi:hypothetical protein